MPEPVLHIFLSYRRADSAYIVDRIEERLVAEFGRAAVFRDLDSIEAGVDFPQALADAARRSSVMLVIIGREWLDARQNGRRRLEDPRDYVRLEVEAGLQFAFRVVPVFVEGADALDQEQLPPSMARLAALEGRLVRPGQDFRHDMDKLVGDLRGILAKAANRSLDSPARAEPSAAAEPRSVIAHV